MPAEVFYSRHGPSFHETDLSMLWEYDLSASIIYPQDTGHHRLVCVLVTAVCWSGGRGDWHMMSDCLMPCLCLGPQLV